MTTNEITAFFHCRGCFDRKPPGMPPKRWARFEVGWTPQGVQVWCLRCDRNIVHIKLPEQREILQ
jgi:hypothetical protein